MKRVIALILSAVIALGGLVAVAGAAAVNEKDKQYPSIIVPGVFQSEVKMYDEDGNVMKNSDGDEYSAPFFLEGTNDIVKAALKNALLPLAGLLLTQHDFEERAANALADTIADVIGGNIALDENGQNIKNIHATKYNTSVANLSEHDRNYILDQVPLQEYVAKAGADKLYFLSYVSTGNMIDTANELYELIQIAKRESGMDKVNLVPISQGGSVCDALMQVYRDKGESFSADVHRVVYIVPAADGAAVLGDVYRYGLLDDADALYGYMFPNLLDEDQEWLAYFINIVLRIFPNADLNNILDKAVDALAGRALKNSTLMWALIPSEDYPACAEKYLSGDENAKIKAQTDWFYNAQLHHREYILEYKAEGVEYFDIVDYDYALYSICDSWDEENADGIIDTDSESFGATAAPVGCSLGDDYVQQNTYCTAPGQHNHMDSTKTVDATTGILCESTFYFKYQDHEKTARNNVLIKLAIRILTDDTFTDVYSDPAFPQFNYARQSYRMREAIDRAKQYRSASVSSDTMRELNDAIAAAEEAYNSTVMETAEYNARMERLNEIVYVIENGKAEKASVFVAFITKVLKHYSDFLLKFFGGKGFSDIILFR